HSSRGRVLGFTAAGLVAGAAAVAVALTVSGSVWVAVVAGVLSPVLLMLLHHVWAHGPPWARTTIKVIAILAVTAVTLALTGSAARADTGAPTGPARAAGSAYSDAGGLLLTAGAAAAVIIVGWFAVTDVAARVLARWVWPVQVTELPHDGDTVGGHRP